MHENIYKKKKSKIYIKIYEIRAKKMYLNKYFFFNYNKNLHSDR